MNLSILLIQNGKNLYVELFDSSQGYMYSFEHRDDKLELEITLTDERSCNNFSAQISIELSDLNRHIFKQLEEAMRCIEAKTEYKWTDLPVAVKSARNI